MKDLSTDNAMLLRHKRAIEHLLGVVVAIVPALDFPRMVRCTRACEGMPEPEKNVADLVRLAEPRLLAAMQRKHGEDVFEVLPDADEVSA